VDHVEAEQERYLQARLFDGDALELVRPFGPAHVERGAEQPLPDHLDVLGPVVAVRLAVELLKLPEFLFQGHAREQGVDLLLDIGLRPRRLGKSRGMDRSGEDEGQ
jgi:hypothetical protein